MRRLVEIAVFGCLAGLGLSGFSEPSPDQASSAKTKSDLEDYEKFYRTAFRESSIQKCVASAPKATAAGFDVTPTCVCASEAILARKSLDQLEKIRADNAPTDELVAVSLECLKTNPPVKANKAK